MKIVTSTGCFKGTQEQKLEAIKKSGYSCADISFFSSKNVLEFMTPDWQDKAKKLKEYAEKIGIEFVQSHTPYVPFGAEITQESIDLTRRSIEVAGMLGVKNTVIHPACPASEPEKELEFIKNFFTVLEKYDINLLLENAPNHNVRTGGEKPDRCYTGKQLLDLIECVNHPNVHACWDTGHANLVCRDQREEILTLGDHLKAIHFNDNNGFMDLHLLPFGGTMKVEEIMLALKEIGYNGYFTFECHIFTGADDYYREQRGGKETSLVEIPTEFKIKEQKLMYEIGEFLLNYYGIEVE